MKSLERYIQDINDEIDVIHAKNAQIASNSRSIDHALDYIIRVKLERLERVVSEMPEPARWIDNGKFLPTCSNCLNGALIYEWGELVGCSDPSGETGGHYEEYSKPLWSKYCPYCGAKMTNAEE